MAKKRKKATVKPIAQSEFRSEKIAKIMQDPDKILYVPLGGAGEIGMNMYLYGYMGKWIIVDVGITFAEESLPGVDIYTADPSFILDEIKTDNIEAIILTHVHEDHFGAIPYLANELDGIPIYATPFAAGILRYKLTDRGIKKGIDIKEIRLGGDFKLGQFKCQFVTLSHSIPEPNGLLIETPAGKVFHTGDWKLDQHPQIGKAYSPDELEAIGNGKILAMTCDSTNANVPGHTGSEEEALAGLTKAIAACKKGVFITCFASNVARVRSIALAAKKAGRRAMIAGRSLRMFTEIAGKQGMLHGVDPLLSEKEFKKHDPSKIVVICSGSQGEHRSALKRISDGTHGHITIQPGDTVMFSSRVIPGNEKSIGYVQNNLIRSNVHLFTDRDEVIHVSGHPAREELKQMYDWIRPTIAIPMHGELQHLVAHVDLAKKSGAKESHLVENGHVLCIDKSGTAEIVDNVHVGRWVVDGQYLYSANEKTIKNRKKIIWDGIVFASIAFDKDGLFADYPQISAPGMYDMANEDDKAILRQLRGDILKEIDRTDVGGDRDRVKETCKRVMRHHFKKSFGRRPLIEMHVLEV